MAISIETLSFLVAQTTRTQCRILERWLCSRAHHSSPNPVSNFDLGGEPSLRRAALAAVPNVALVTHRRWRFADGLPVLVVACGLAPRPAHVAFPQCPSFGPVHEREYGSAFSFW